MIHKPTSCNSSYAFHVQKQDVILHAIRPQTPRRFVRSLRFKYGDIQDLRNVSKQFGHKVVSYLRLNEKLRHATR